MVERYLNGVKVRYYKGELTAESKKALKRAEEDAKAPLPMPTKEDLQDPIKRDEWAATIAIYVLDKGLPPERAKIFQALLKEIRENSKITDIRNQVLVIKEKLDMVISHKSGLTIEEIRRIYEDLKNAGV